MGGDLVDPDRLLDVLDLLWPQIGEVGADFAVTWSKTVPEMQMPPF